MLEQLNSLTEQAGADSDALCMVVTVSPAAADRAAALWLMGRAAASFAAQGLRTAMNTWVENADELAWRRGLLSGLVSPAARASRSQSPARRQAEAEGAITTAPAPTLDARAGWGYP